MNPGAIHGVWAASITPFTNELSVDFDRLGNHAGHLLSEGCEGIALFGTTGEGPSFTVAERIITLETLLGSGIPPERVLVGTGCPSLGDTVALSRHASEQGVAGVLVMPPYLFQEPEPRGLIAWYRALLDQIADVDGRVYLYHYPQLSGVIIGNELIDALLESHPHSVYGVKDSSGNPATLTRYLAYSDQLAILPGTERGLLDGLAGGGTGLITAGANVNAAGIVETAISGDPAKMLAVRNEVDRHGGIVALKAALAVDAVDPMNLVRPPLVPLEGEARQAASDAIREALAS